MLKILQVHNRQTVMGGADSVIEREAELLRSHGHEVSLFTVASKDIAGLGMWRTALRAIWNRHAASQLREAIRTFQPDIAHFHTVFPLLSPAAFRAAHQAGIPTVETIHNFRLICPGGLLQRDGAPCHLCIPKSIALPAIQHKCYRGSRLHSIGLVSTLTLHHLAGTFRNHIDRYLALTDFVREKLIEGGFPENKIVVKPNFIQDSGPVGTGQGRYALFVGRFHPIKGIMTLMEAWKSVSPDYKLILVGDGPLQEQVAEAAQGRNIELRGWLPSESIFELLRNAAFLVFPSNCYESGPLAPIEAFSCGTPVLASDIGNFSEWIHEGQNGWLFKTNQAADLAAKIEAAMKHPDLYGSFRTHAKATHTTRFSMSANYELLMSIYRDIIQERQSKAGRRQK